MLNDWPKLLKDRHKFRVWDKELREFRHNHLLGLDGMLYEWGEWRPDQEPERYVTEICTGVKDSTGKLIYEGDCIAFIDDDGKLHTADVVWGDGLSGAWIAEWHELDTGGRLKRCSYFSDKWKIVGNIHEREALSDDAKQ